MWRGDSGTRGVARRGIATIATGSALGSALAFLASPIITRLFNPSEFGQFSIALSVAAIIGTVGSARLELAVPLPKEDSDARAIVIIGALAAGVTFVMTLLVAALLTLLFPRLGSYLIAITVLFAPTAAYQLLNAWALRRSQFGVIATRNVLQTSATVVAQITLGAIGYGFGGLVAGACVGQLVGVLSIWFTTDFRHVPSVGRGRIRELATTYRRFPLILTPAGLANVLGAQAPLMLIAVTFGAHAAGLFALAQRIVSMPVGLLGQAAAQVYLSELARMKRDDEYQSMTSLFFDTSRSLGYVAIPLVVLGVPLSPWAFPLVFGNEWSTAGVISMALCVAAGAQLVATPLSTTFLVFDRLATIAVWDVIRLIGASLCILVGWRSGIGLVPTTWMLSVFTALSYVAYWTMSRRTLINALGSRNLSPPTGSSV